MRFDIDFEQEEDGQWIAEIPGVLAYDVWVAATTRVLDLVALGIY